VHANLTTETTSLLSLRNILLPHLEPFQTLKEVLTSTTSTALLTALHEQACESHATGNFLLHEFIQSLFLPSLETYLRPLHGWMTTGTLDPQIYPEFFITSQTTESKVLYEVNGPPEFMQHVTKRVLAAGKTINFIRTLHPLTTSLPQTSFTAFVQHHSDASSMNPFEQSFDRALEQWITQKYDFASRTLRETLRSSREIWDQLEWLHGVYCGLDVPGSRAFLGTLWDKMNGRGDWRDRHVLTDDLQEAFVGTIPADRLAVRIQRTCSLTLPLKCLDFLKLHVKVSSPLLVWLTGDFTWDGGDSGCTGIFADMYVPPAIAADKVPPRSGFRDFFAEGHEWG
jgi:Gamma tubulin complex component N-terminal